MSCPWYCLKGYVLSWSCLGAMSCPGPAQGGGVHSIQVLTMEGGQVSPVLVLPKGVCPVLVLPGGGGGVTLIR